MSRRSDRNLLLALLLVGAAAAVVATAYVLRPSYPSAAAFADDRVTDEPASRAEPVVALERPVERAIVPPAPVAPAAPMPSPFEAKYVGAEASSIAAARSEIAERLRITSTDVAAERFRRGEYETHVVATGRDADVAARPSGWFQSIRRSQREDGAEEIQIAGFAQGDEPRTRDLYAELAWLDARAAAGNAGETR